MFRVIMGHSTLILYAAFSGLAQDAGPSGGPHFFRHRRHDHEDRSRSRDHLPGERAASSGGRPAIPASSWRPVPDVSAAGAGRQQACHCEDAKPALDARVEGVESAILLCPSGNQVSSSSDAPGPGFTAPDAMKAKGPATPTEAQGLAIANLVFHGEADLLPAPFHRFGDFPPGANADPVATVSSEEEEEQGPEQSRLHCVFQLFAIDHAPQSVSVVLETPCTSADALAAVHEGVEAEFYRQFPRLLEVKPQPFSAWGCFLALPEWTHSESVVLLDLSAYDGRCFAATVPSPFSVAQLFRIARLPDTADLEVFALGAPRPMLEDDLVEAFEAGSVVFKPRGARWVVQGTSLQLMLWRGPAAWDPDPVFHRPPVGFYLLIVSPVGTRLFTARSRPVEDPVDEIAGLFGFHVASMVVRPAEPPAIGVMHCGFPCDNVVAVSEADLCRTPLPWAAIIDCRPLLLGWDAVFSTADTWSLEDVAVGISTFCPVTGILVSLACTPPEGGFFSVTAKSSLPSSFGTGMTLVPSLPPVGLLVLIIPLQALRIRMKYQVRGLRVMARRLLLVVTGADRHPLGLQQTQQVGLDTRLSKDATSLIGCCLGWRRTPFLGPQESALLCNPFVLLGDIGPPSVLRPDFFPLTADLGLFLLWTLL